MTENENSPKNLRKFLHSKDPAMVMMGLSMAKGIDMPDELLGEILWMYLMDEDKTIRATAKTLFMKQAPEDARQAVKENWKASYRKGKQMVLPSAAGNGYTFSYQDLSMISTLESALNPTSVSLVEPLIKLIDSKEISAIIALGEIGDTRAVKPLIKALDNSKDPGYKMGIIESGGWADVISSAVEALGMIGDKRAIESLMKLLLDPPGWNGPFYVDEMNKNVYDGESEEGPNICMKAAKALGNIGDTRATDALIEALKDKNDWWEILGSRDYETSSKKSMDFEDENGNMFEGSAVYPVAEVSPNKRAKCKVSGRKIQKGELRIAVETFGAYGIARSYILAEKFNALSTGYYLEVPDYEDLDGTEFFFDTEDSYSEHDSHGNTRKVLMANSNSLPEGKFDELNEIIGGGIGARHHIIRALEKLGHKVK